MTTKSNNSGEEKQNCYWVGQKICLDQLNIKLELFILAQQTEKLGQHEDEQILSGQNYMLIEFQVTVFSEIYSTE